MMKKGERGNKYHRDTVPRCKPHARIHLHMGVWLEKRRQSALVSQNAEREEWQQHCRGHNSMLLTASSKTESVGCASPVASS